MSEREGSEVLPGAARYVQPKVTEARLQRVWARVDARLPHRGRTRRIWGWAGALALAACAMTAVLAVVRHWDPSPEASSLLAGAVLETKSDSLSLKLLDRSSLTLDQKSRVEVLSSNPKGVRLHLKRGRLECDVKPQKGATFVVVADGVEVRVVGTRFSVTAERGAESHRVQVDVQRGTVEVRTPSQSEVVRLTAGRSWSQVTKTGPVADVPPAEASAKQPPEPVPSATPLPSVDATPAGPRALLEEANQLRRAGKIRDAARRYETLLSRYGTDARAGLAAFELGRLRMDRFGDMKGAVSALEKAMTLAPGSGFREDALARVVTAHARSGNQTACQRAKQRYLKSYPRGVHRQAVLDQCSRR